MPDIINPETHHETSDVNVRGLFWFLIIFIAFAILTHLSVWIMFKQFAKMARHTSAPPLTEMARPASARIPDAPRLQPFPTRVPNGEVLPPNSSTPAVDMVEMRAHENQVLNSAAWVDRQKGIVRIPIETAKQLAVQRLNAGVQP
jgi:hypothetical protein